MHPAYGRGVLGDIRQRSGKWNRAVAFLWKSTNPSSVQQARVLPD
jgi:hypothetical protein